MQTLTRSCGSTGKGNVIMNAKVAVGDLKTWWRTLDPEVQSNIDLLMSYRFGGSTLDAMIIGWGFQKYCIWDWTVL